MKKMRNRCYRTLGFFMFLAILIIGIGKLGPDNWISKEFYDSHCLTFWMETVAVECFGFSWLIKGEVILKD